MSGNAPPSIFCRTAGIQRSIEEGLTHGGIQAQGSFFVDIQNGLLHLATLKQKLDLEKLSWERRKEGQFRVQVREVHFGIYSFWYSSVQWNIQRAQLKFNKPGLGDSRGNCSGACACSEKNEESVTRWIGKQPGGNNSEMLHNFFFQRLLPPWDLG